MDLSPDAAPRSLLFVPAGRPRMIAKAAGLAADLVVLDLEDAVPDADKPAAREGLADAVAAFGGRAVAVRVNADLAHAEADVAAAQAAGAALLVVPKAETPADLALAARSGLPVMAMIETPRGVLAAATIAQHAAVAGLIAGTNDLAAALRLPPGAGRASLGHALQAVVLAARAHDRWAIDGVCNALGDADALAAEAREGRALGFDGKSLIHPEQIDPVHRLFGPSEAEIADARALVAAATGGAERFAGRMVEDLHVRAAQALLRRARA